MTTNTSGNGHILTRAEFAAAIEDRILGEAEIELVSRSDQALEMRVRGLAVRAEIDRFYTAYSTNPAQIDTVMDAFVESARTFVPDRAINTYEDLQDRIFPMIKPLKMLADIRERSLPMLAYTLLQSDLMVTYVINEPQSVVYITEAHLERWDVGEQDLHAQALANLRQITHEDRNYKTIGTGAQRLFFWETQDGYDATRLLLTDILSAWQAQLPGQIVIGIPNRDFLIAFSDRDRTVLEGIAHQVQADATQQEFGLTDKLFTLRNGVIREYEWE